MAKKPGAGGVILMAVIFGLATAFFVYKYLREVQRKSVENWKPVVVAIQDIPARTKITREMLSMTKLPEDSIVANALQDPKDAVGHIALEKIKDKEQLRQSDLAKEGQVPGLAYDIPPGKRAIAIAVDEVKGVGATVRPGDHVDILATYQDPVAHQETTQMILQNVPVLAVDKGRTQAGEKNEGATTSITLAVSPEETELVAAADRAGVLRVSLRPDQEKTIVSSPGMRVSEILRGKYFEPAPKVAGEPKATPVIISPPPSREKPELKIIRGVQETTVRME